MTEADMAPSKYLSKETDRHGKPRLYYRTWHGKRIRLYVMPGHPEFDAAIAAAEQGRKWIPGKGPEGKPLPTKGSVRALVGEFYQSEAFRSLDATTRAKRRAILTGCMDEPIKPGAADMIGDCPTRLFSRAHVITLRDRKQGSPEAANGRIKAIRRLFNWAVAEGKAETNPAAGLALARSVTGGHHTWTIEEVRQFHDRHPLGSKARLVMDLLLYTGLRISDAARLGKQHVANGEASIVQWKNRNRSRKVLTFPILPILRASIAAHPSSGLTFIETAYGRPHSTKGLGNAFRAWCDEAGLPHCSAHGLRKAGATFAAENGATAHQLMAIYGWSKIEQAELYTKAANLKRMARESMHLIEPFPNQATALPDGQQKKRNTSE